jgi:hypothetical protein
VIRSMLHNLNTHSTIASVEQALNQLGGNEW